EYNPENRTEAFKRALEWGDRIPVGIIYRNSRQMLEERIPIIMDKPLVKQLPDLSKLETTLKEFY
ncbi:MAG: 2-oxoacid ferredoxin oxidoreductase, partial [Nitrospirota bacterium]